MSPGDELRNAAETLAAAGVASPVLDAEILLAHALDIPRETLLLVNDQTLTLGQTEKFQALVTRRAGREPVARITGVQEFWSLPFFVGRDTLIPRPDSETLVAAVLKTVAGGARLRILDLGTGSGCLLLALLSELPQATGLGVDVSTGALAVAKKNAATLGLAARVAFQKYDWSAEPPITGGPFDVVISNPPYIPAAEIPGLQPEVSSFAPPQALDGGAGGLDHYQAILRHTPEFFGLQGGIIFFEIGAGQAADVGGFLKETGFKDIKTCADLAGILRVISAKMEKP